MFAAVYAGFAIAPDALSVAGLFVVYGLYYALTEGVGKALIADLVPASLRATALGTFYTVTGALLLPASVIAGVLWQEFGPPAPFAYGAATAILSAVLLLVLPLRQAGEA